MMSLFQQNVAAPGWRNAPLKKSQLNPRRLTARLPGSFRVALLALAGVFAASAQTGIVIPPGGFDKAGITPPIKVNIAGFTGEVNSVLNFDLYVMGFINVPADQAQYLITGTANPNLQGTVTDANTKFVSVNTAYSGGSLRRQAHAFADEIAKKCGGFQGIAQTKIAFKVDTGKASEIYMSDYDGFNAKALTSDKTIVAAPAWIPGRLALYYTSYRLGSPDIFRHNLTTGERTGAARYPGSNISPAASPDGQKLAMILGKDGWTDLYVSNADGTGLKRLTKSREDESSPCWSPDGQWICYAGKQGGVRGLYKVSAAGGTPQRIITSGVSSPSEPDWSPDGKWIAFTSQMGGFEICVVEAAGGPVTVLVSGEDPSWAPNSRTVVFARRSGGARHLSLLDVPTKQVKDAARISGSNSQPSWAR